MLLLTSCQPRDLLVEDKLTGLTISATLTPLISDSGNLETKVTFKVTENGVPLTSFKITGAVAASQLSNGTISSGIEAFLENNFSNKTTKKLRFSNLTNTFSCPATDINGNSSCKLSFLDPNDEKIYEAKLSIANISVTTNKPIVIYPVATLRESTFTVSEESSNSMMLPTLYLTSGTRVFINGAECLSLVAINKGSHQCTTNGLSHGDYDIKFVSPDGRERSLIEKILVRDTLAPIINITSPNAGTTAKNQITLTGACETGLDITFSGTGLLNPFTVNCSTGNYEQSVFFSDNEGVKSITLSQQDIAGNSTTISRDFVRDLTPPLITQTALSSTYYSSSNTVSYGGACESGLQIQIKRNGISEATLNCVESVWNYTVNPQTSDGNRAYTFTQIDSAGNQTTVTSNWRRDTVAPILKFANNSSSFSQITADNSATFSGICETGFNVTVSGAATATVNCVSGAWNYTTPTIYTDGILNYTFTQIDLAGNSTVITGAWERNTQAPILTMTSAKTYINNADFVIFSGICQEDLDILILKNGSTLTTIDCPISGSWNYSVPQETSDNTYTYDFKQTNALTLTTTVTGIWTRDTQAPTVDNLEMTDGIISLLRYGTFNLTGDGTGSKIKEFCIIVQNATQPANDSNCWKDISTILTPAENVELNGIEQLIGIIPGSYSIYTWLKDEAQNISTSTPNSSITVNYAPINPPKIESVLVSKNENISGSRSERQIATGQPAYIKWKASGDQISSGSVSLWVTFNDLDWQEIVSGKNNAQNGGCTLDGPGPADDSSTGCFNWTSPSSNYYRIRVSITNDIGAVSFGASLPVNASPIEVIAGNTEDGLGGDAKAGVFFLPQGGGSASYPQSLMVNKKGVIYILDTVKGLVGIEPKNGKIEQIIPIKSNCTFTSAETAITSACLINPMKMFLDKEDNIWIYDNVYIRKLDTAKSPMTIMTVAGGGEVVESSSPLDLKIFAATIHNVLTFTYMPDESIWFTTQYNGSYTNLQPTKKMSRLSPDRLSVTHFNITGDNDARGAVDVSGCGIYGGIGYTHDPDTNQIGVAVLSLSRNATSGACARSGANSEYSLATIDPTTYSTTGETQVPVFDGAVSITSQNNMSVSFYSSRSGSLYAYGKQASYLKKYNEASNQWITIAGNGTRGTCPDGREISDPDCPLNLDDVYVDENENIFMLENGAVRVIDSNNKIQTLYGQSLFYGDGDLAVNARFSLLSIIQKAPSSGKYGVIDYYNYRIREFTAGGDVETVIGNGIGAAGADLNLDSRTQPYNLNASVFDLGYFTYTRDDDILYHPTVLNIIHKWDRSTFTATPIISPGATLYSAADNTTNNTAGSWTRNILFGYHDGLIFSGMYRTVSSSSYEQTLATTDTDNNNLYLIQATNNSIVGNFCDDGTPLNMCRLLASTNSPYVYSWSQYDEATESWLILKNSTNNVRVIKRGENMVSLPGLTENAKSFIRVRTISPNKDYLFYCSSDSGRLRRADITDPMNVVDKELTWKIESMTCESKSLVYDEDRDSLVFIFKQNGSFGVAEYVDPTGMILN